ncbi:MAG: hypothetical protein EON89_10010 [Brevundimonas sp.]|nr:MAG: hypothetical protein EON89_10010 [Brevundimonas sp.]
MRIAALLAAAASLTLSACNKPAEEAPAPMTEAAEASGAAVDTAAVSSNEGAMAAAPQPTPGGAETPGEERQVTPPAP